MNTNDTSGRFFVIEGPDGSGKTSQLNRLKTFLEQAGYDVVIAREPGGTEQGQKIRQLFFDGQGKLVPMAEVMLLLAAKAQLLQEVIYPAFNSGRIVLMDRYTDSLLAYQGGGRQMGQRVLCATVRAAELNFPPNLTIYIDCPIDVCLERIAARAGEENNTIDALGRAYHERVHAAYKDMHKGSRGLYFESTPCAVVNGNQPESFVHVDVITQLQEHLPEPKRASTHPARHILDGFKKGVSVTAADAERDFQNVWAGSPVAELRD